MDNYNKLKERLKKYLDAHILAQEELIEICTNDKMYFLFTTKHNVLTDVLEFLEYITMIIEEECDE